MIEQCDLVVHDSGDRVGVETHGTHRSVAVHLGNHCLFLHVENHNLVGRERRFGTTADECKNVGGEQNVYDADTATKVFKPSSVTVCVCVSLLLYVWHYYDDDDL